jgi:serine/threonine-protein kinase
MVTFDGNVKVIDFGIAKAKGRLGRTQVGMVKGTTGYMSPEQVRGSELDGRSDLFCTGIILHELLCGRRLFTGAHEGEVMLKIAEAEVPPPSSINPRVPKALDQVVMRALAREPAERFASGRELARAIESACGAELFHEEQMAAVMRQLFEDRIQKTRALLESANSEGESTTGQFEALDAGTQKEPPQESVTERRPALRTPPAPKPAPRRPTAPAVSARTPVSRVGKPPRPVAAPVPEEAEEDSSELTQPRRAPVMRSSRVAEPEESGPHTVPSRAALEQPEAPRQSSGWGGRLFLVLLLAAIGGAIYYPPTRALLTPLYAAAVTEVKALKGDGLPEGPPPAEPLPLPRTPPPATASAEQASAEPAPSTPEPGAGETAGASASAPQPAKPSAIEPKRTRKQTAAVAKAETKPEPKPVAEAKSPAGPEVDSEPEVIDTRTAKGAAKAEIGWLTLFTVPRAAVFEGDDQLGTAPLRKVPLPKGTYRLRVVDTEGASRMLSAPIKPGQLTEMTVRLSDLPYWEED